MSAAFVLADIIKLECLGYGIRRGYRQILLDHPSIATVVVSTAELSSGVVVAVVVSVVTVVESIVVTATARGCPIVVASRIVPEVTAAIASCLKMSPLTLVVVSS